MASSIDSVDRDPSVDGNETFSDIPLGGSTAGTILQRNGLSLAIREALNPDGVRVEVTGSGTEIEIALDDKASTISLPVGTYVVTDPEMTSTVLVDNGGPAPIEMILNGIDAVLIVESGSSVTFTETLDSSGHLVGLSIDEVTGDVTLNGSELFEPITLIGPPQTRNDCMRGGWMEFNFPQTFPYQGQCIRFVNTGEAFSESD